MRSLVRKKLLREEGLRFSTVLHRAWVWGHEIGWVGEGMSPTTRLRTNLLVIFVFPLCLDLIPYGSLHALQVFEREGAEVDTKYFH